MCRPNESGIAITCPPFEKKDNFVCSYGGRRFLGMHKISSNSASCVCDIVGACSKAFFTSWMPPNSINMHSYNLYQQKMGVLVKTIVKCKMSIARSICHADRYSDDVPIFVVKENYMRLTISWSVVSTVSSITKIPTPSGILSKINFTC